MVKWFVVLGAVGAVASFSIASGGQTTAVSSVTVTNSGGASVSASAVQVGVSRTRTGPTSWGNAQIAVSMPLKSTAVNVTLDGAALNGTTATVDASLVSGSVTGSSVTVALHRTGSTTDDWRTWAESTIGSSNPTLKAVGVRVMNNTVELRRYTAQGCLPSKYELNVNADTTNDETLTLSCSAGLTVVGGPLVTTIGQFLNSVSISGGARTVTYTSATGGNYASALRFVNNAETYVFVAR